MKKAGNWSLVKLPLLMIFSLLLIISACSKTESSGDDANRNHEGQDTETIEEDSEAITYEADVKEIIANNCLTCHGDASPLPLHDYESLMVFVNGDSAGAFMRSLDNGENREDVEPGNMYEYLGESDEEREANLAVLKEWVGNWTVEDKPSEEELKSIKAPEN